MLPFTADVLFSSFAQYNGALWPVPILAPALAAIVVPFTLRPLRHSSRILSAVLGLAWTWVGIGYFILYFSAFDFAAPGYGLVFALEGLLLLWAGAVRGRLAFRFAGDLFGWCGLVLVFAAMLAGPLADWLSGYDWAGSRVVGLAPGPTAVFTLGMLLLVIGRTPLHLALIPLLWTLVAGATGWILGIPQDLVLPAAGIGAVVLIVWRNRRIDEK